MTKDSSGRLLRSPRMASDHYQSPVKALPQDVAYRNPEAARRSTDVALDALLSALDCVPLAQPPIQRTQLLSQRRLSKALHKEGDV